MRHNKFILGVDIGGTHISSALVSEAGEVIKDSFFKQQVDSSVHASGIIGQWIEVISKTISGKQEIHGIGISMPGPFDYTNGISLMNGVSKYHSLFGINVRELFINRLQPPAGLPVLFENDAACFGLGESLGGEHQKLIAITLGTGFGATFIEDGRLLKEGEGVPENGYLYCTRFKDGIAEDYISSAWIRNKYRQLSGNDCTVKEIAVAAMTKHDHAACAVFEEFGENLASCLGPWIKSFKPDSIVIGGSISKAQGLFLPAVQRTLAAKDVIIEIKISGDVEISAIKGAANMVRQHSRKQPPFLPEWRKSIQPLMPLEKKKTASEGYDIYPYFSLSGGRLFSGYASLAKWMSTRKIVAIDGYAGNDWGFIRERLSAEFKHLSFNVLWYELSAFLKNPEVIDRMVAPFLGETRSVWGKRSTLSLVDFFDNDKLGTIQPDPSADLTILLGPGSSLPDVNAAIVYIDMPKNEIQYRMRAGSVANLGKTDPNEPFQQYKRYYFVDWPVLNRHRQAIKERISVVADGQWRDEIHWTFHSFLEDALHHLSTSIIRPRPWFEAGAWGGQWMKEHMPTLNKKEINYAWSFELITPENGIVFESDGRLLEVSFEWLMEFDNRSVLGRDAERFGTEFPIRFDFLDTFDGGNLSIQCHPGLDYIQREFGETITQDETYYILDCKGDSGVYLGFQDNIDPAEFREHLEYSLRQGSTIDIENFVQFHPSRKHDLFLIPNKTIHGSGIDNLVLEISSTPYIFTFKMYDWVRLDLDGKPRPINIGHAFHNLDFERKGEKVAKELISVPYVLEEHPGFRIIHLPTHPEHFYDVHRIEFLKKAFIATNDQCHILMLVEGSSIEVVTADGYIKVFHFAETFVIPAAARSYRLINRGAGEAKVIKAFIK